jgi:hypothetical protein
MGALRKIWVLCLIGTGLAFFATATPVLGILFVILGAPFWPIVLLNLAFVAMAFDAWISRSKILLIVPLLWFGGYGLIATISHVKVAALRSDAAQLNSHAPAAWDRKIHMVRIDKADTSSERLASDITPSMLVMTYGLNTVYQGSYAGALTQRTSLKPQNCPERGISSSGNIQHQTISRNPTRDTTAFAQGVCLEFESKVQSPAAPLVVTLIPARELSGLVDGIAQDITISGPSQPPYKLRASQVVPLPWLPMPIVGCHYKGGFGDSWDRGCHAEFGFTSWRGQKDNTPIAVLSRTLGLKPMTLDQRLPNVVWK